MTAGGAPRPEEATRILAAGPRGSKGRPKPFQDRQWLRLSLMQTRASRGVQRFTHGLHTGRRRRLTSPKRERAAPQANALARTSCSYEARATRAKAALAGSLLLTHRARWSKCRPQGGLNFGEFLRNVGGEGGWVSVERRFPSCGGAVWGFGARSNVRTRTVRVERRLRRVQVTGQPPRLGTCLRFSRVPISRSRAQVAAKKRPRGRPVPQAVEGVRSTARRWCAGGRGSRPSHGRGHPCPRETGAPCSRPGAGSSTAAGIFLPPPHDRVG